MRTGIRLLVHGALPLLRQCVVAFGIAVFFILQASAEPFEIQVHETEVSGTRALLAGDYHDAIESLEKARSRGIGAMSKKVAVLSNLCLAYTMVEEFEAASDSCKLAIETGWNTGLTYNNRGVLNAAQGNYAAAIGDFRQAAENRSQRRVATRNLDLAEERLSAMLSKQKEAAATAASLPAPGGSGV